MTDSQARPTAAIEVSGVTIEWDIPRGTCTFAGLPVAMMWVDTTMASLMAGVQAMVGAERFALALQSEGRRSVEADWQVISSAPSFEAGFGAIASIAAVAGWGVWRLVSLDRDARVCRVRVEDSWEGRYQKALGTCWGSGMLAGKLAGYASRLFQTNCWADQIAFLAKGDPCDEFVVSQSDRTIEAAIDDLLLGDMATRADMAVALKRLQDEVVERKRAEDALRDSEGRARALLSALPDMVFRVSADGVFIDFQAEASQLFTGPQDIIGRKADDIFPPEFARQTHARIRQTLKAGTLQVFEYSLPMPNLGPRDYEARMVVSGADEITAIVRDITDHKRAESAKAELEARLAQAQKEESIGRLAGGVAHDFNNLLAVQLGYCELMVARLDPGDPLAEGLAEIKACADKAAALTRQLLAFSRKQVLQPSVFDLNVLVARLDRLLQRLIGEDIHLVTTTSASPARVKADPGQLEQVLVNLAANARDAMPRGGRLVIEVSSVSLADADVLDVESATAGDYALLVVGDTGCGMDADTRRRIFEPFFTTKGRTQGTGLGLATVYGIVRQSGGFVNVESGIDEGTTFRIYLPLAGGPTESRPEPPPDVPRGAGETILIVEDDTALRRLAEQIVRRLGYTVHAAPSGPAALALVERGLRPHLVITDVVMPEMSGPSLVERLGPLLPDARVLYISGYTDDAIRHHGALDPGVTFLQKPFTIASLAGTIRDALTRM